MGEENRGKLRAKKRRKRKRKKRQRKGDKNANTRCERGGKAKRERRMNRR